MRLILLSGFLALASTVFADVTFSVIGFPDDKSNTYAVEINKELHPLKTSKDTFPLWSANVAGVSATSGYRYVQLNKKHKVVAREKFLREFSNKDATATLNEFFNRQNTITTFPTLKQVYEDVRPEPSKAFDSTQIATIHLTADPDTFSDMMDNPLDSERKAIKAGFRFINADTVYSVGEVGLKVSGHGSRKYKKVSLRLKFNDDKGETFFDRPNVKLRAQYVDPSMIREKLYLDILNSVGVSPYQGSYVRVFVNGKPQGFYLMVEDVEEHSIMNNVHHGTITDKKDLGSLYQMGSGHKAALLYRGPRTDDYNHEIYENKIRGNNTKDEPMKQFIAFLKDLRDWNPASAGGIAYWKQRLDLDGYLRSTAVEYLAGGWDSFWYRGNNYFMYFNPQSKVWQFIPTDFDHTFSSGNKPDIDTTYKKFAQKRLRGGSRVHPMINKLIHKNKEINKEFETTLLTISQGVFNSKALDGRINAYEKQIEEDAAWDLSIDRSDLPGKDLEWTFSDFHNAFKGSVKTVPDGIKPWIAGRTKSVPKQLRHK